MKALRLPQDSVAEKVIRAAHEVSAFLTAQGIPHALIGGLAVGAHGYERATRDVDFLLHSSARSQISGKLLGAGAQGVAANHKGVAVDFLFPDEHEEFLDYVVEHAERADGVPVVPESVLIYLKMKVSRRKDQHDIRELVKSGKISVPRAKTFLKRYRHDLVEDFDSIVSEADLED